MVSHPHYKFFKTSKVTFTREEIDKLPRGIVMSFEDNVAFEPIGIPKTWEEEYKKSLKAAPKP